MLKIVIHCVDKRRDILGHGYILDSVGVKIIQAGKRFRVYPWHVIDNIECWEAAKNEPEDKLDAAQETGEWAMNLLGDAVFGDKER